MGRDYIPFRDAEFDEWLERFTAYMSAHYAEIGLSAADKDNIVAVNSAWKRDYKAHQTAKNASLGAKRTKNQTRKMAGSLARNLAQRSTVFPGTTNAHRLGMGITVPDTKPTAVPAEYVDKLPAPLLLLDWSGRGQVTIHFGVNPGNEKENAKPPAVAGAQIWYRIGTGSWTFVAADTNSPYTHNLGITEPTSVGYRTQWVDKKMRTGPFSETAKCTVTP